ncbi:MAG TPA: phosphodiester glycosidase family protein [Bryobacteraceae bacterium]|jgi:exopolysaccharide biosynthesis protein|nr:phosphodiester glycosidase family protein [Bryobacteraceae bacterium]
MRPLSGWRSGLLFLAAGLCFAADTIEHPFAGVTHTTREHMHIVQIDLRTPGIRFKLTPHSGRLETVRQTTLEFLEQERAQIAINAHFFLPFPSEQPETDLIGFAASDGKVYSRFEKPKQSYALVRKAPALNIDRKNCVKITRRGWHAWTTVAGSAQIVTKGVKTIPVYKDATHPRGQLVPGGPRNYSNSNSWYDVATARTAIGVTRGGKTLVLITVERMAVGAVADLLIREYGVWDALNLDGGGSTTLAMENPATHTRSIVNALPRDAKARSVGSSLAVFAQPIP